MPGLGKLTTRSALLAIAATVVSSATAAQATVVDSGHFAGSESGVPDEICGISAVRDSTFSGTFRIRQGKGADDQAFFLRQNFRFADTFTNPDNGQSVTIEGHSLYNEVKATRVEGNVFEFATIEAGQPFAILDSAGNVLVRDRGVIRRMVLFDTLGDSAPGGVTLDEQIVRVSGPHAGLDDASNCAIVTSLIG